MTHVKALQAGQSSQGTSEPITPAAILDDRKSLLIGFFFTKWLPAAILDDQNHFRSHFSPFQINTHFLLLIFFHKMAANGHFGWQKITFDRISRHFGSIRNFFFPQNGCQWPFWMTENHFWSHFSQLFFWFLFTKLLPAAILDDRNHFRSYFSPFQINTQLLFFTKWLPAVILDDQRSLLIAFLTISDKYATLIFFFTKRLFFYFSQNGCWRPFWMTENHFRSHFSPFQINTKLYFFSQNGCRRPFWMTENHFWSHFSPFQINTKLWYFFSQNGCRRPFWMTENHFWSYISPFQINTQFSFFFPQNGCRRPFWLTKNHFRSHFSPFQINTQLFDSNFFSKWPPAAIFEIPICAKTIGFFHYVLSMAMPNMKLIGEFMTQLEMPQAFWAFLYKMATILEVRFGPFWITENHFRSHFSPFQINTQLFFFSKWPPEAILFFRLMPKIIRFL